MEAGGFLFLRPYSDDLPYWIMGPSGPASDHPPPRRHDMLFRQTAQVRGGDQFFTYLKVQASDVLYAEGETSPRMISVRPALSRGRTSGRAASLMRFLSSTTS